MNRWRNRYTGKCYEFKTTAMDCTPGNNNRLMAIYSPSGNPHQTYVMDQDEFYIKYEEYNG